MNIRWSRQALEDLASLYAFIAQDNPTAAQRMVERIVEVVETLLPEHTRIAAAPDGLRERAS